MKKSSQPVARHALSNKGSGCVEIRCCCGTQGYPAEMRVMAVLSGGLGPVGWAHNMTPTREEFLVRLFEAEPGKLSALSLGDLLRML